MREILFRGFHKDENGSETIYIDGQAYKGKWVYGDLTQVPREKCNIIITEYKKLSDDLWEQTPYIVIPETVGQFSGLKDKNRKKIFEGDVTTFYDGLCEDKFIYDAIVKWDKESASFILENETGIWNFDRFSKNIEVIGTKFDKEVE